MSALLQTTDLTCVKDDRILFEDLNLSLIAGQILLVEGKNGSGKTSLLRILTGLNDDRNIAGYEADKIPVNNIIPKTPRIIVGFNNDSMPREMLFILLNIGRKITTSNIANKRAIAVSSIDSLKN